MYKCSRGVEPGTTWLKCSWWSEWDLNSRSSDFKSGALTTRPHCLKMPRLLCLIRLFTLLTPSIYFAHFIRLLCSLHAYSHITPVLESLHWLPIGFRAKFKITLLVFKALKGMAPSCLRHVAKSRNRTDQRSWRKHWFGVARGLKFVMSVQGNDRVRFLYLAACYLSGMLQPKPTSRCSLRSNNENLFIIPRTRCKTFGDRAFAVAGPQIWNNLPLQRERLKT